MDDPDQLEKENEIKYKIAITMRWGLIMYTSEQLLKAINKRSKKYNKNFDDMKFSEKTFNTIQVKEKNPTKYYDNNETIIWMPNDKSVRVDVEDRKDRNGNVWRYQQCRNKTKSDQQGFVKRRENE